MDVKTVRLVAFSPTGTTKRVLQAIAEGTGVEMVLDGSITLPDRNQHVSLTDDLVIFGVPVYSGRIPSVAVERLHTLRGDKTPAVIVAVYGNRAFEDALLELRDLVSENGFIPFAAGAFIGEHTFATDDYPTAMGRPDTRDLAFARTFGKDVAASLVTCDEVKRIDVPGNIPHRDGGKPSGIAPTTDVGLCTLCGICESVCPTGAIQVATDVVTDAAACIQCCACIRQCPTQARAAPARYGEIAKWLWTKFSERREPEVFMP